MMDNYHFQVRVTGLLMEDNQILLVKQRVSSNRAWSLPGGRAEAGETLEEAIARELLEETGLHVKVNKLLYLCDKTDCAPPILHITFLLENTGGTIVMPTNEFDANPISDVKFVRFSDLTALGFSQTFVDLLMSGLPNAGSYQGSKENIGL